ncbi:MULTISPECIES: DNA gyrase inhibitor YacG [unclassified Yoonia]|uniref:DNA gyrase inhibitor YacG n=1 Tax=unclassified Yoonia TaxID=2629118 RepID=UPI002AFEEFAA|nr:MULTISPECIES: DNA gyrase inhibitor YacG [unclassified Yoonia]
MACPICNRPTEKAYRPFCSRRCADVDLGKWLTGSYAIPAGRDDAEDDDPDLPQDDDGKLH